MAKSKTSPKKKSKPSKEAKGSREQSYVDSLDLRSMWESFTLDMNSNGTIKYKTIWSFIQKQTKVDWQRDLLYWLLGPTVEDNPASKYKAFEQFDWEKKRTNGFWYASKNVEQLTKTVGEQANAFAKLGALGDINLGIIGRLQAISQQIDREFAQGIFLPTLSQKENAMRSQLFFELNNQLLAQMKQAQEMFARTQGVEMQQLNQFLQTFASGMGQAAGLGASMGLFAPQASRENDGMKSVSQQLSDMITQKALMYGLDVPTKEMEGVIVNATKPQLIKRG